MKSKRPARSVVFNSGFRIVVFLFAVFVFAAANGSRRDASDIDGIKPKADMSGSEEVNSSGLDSGVLSRAPAQSILASQRPLGGQCVTLRGPILTLSTSADIASVDTASAAFNSQADEFLLSWDQLIGMSWAVYDQRLAVDGTLLGVNNPVIQGTDTFIEPAVAYNADTNQYFVTWRFQGGGPGSNG
jgi:hypothetical protein